MALFNVAEPAEIIWIGIGLSGQFLFASRMIIQWITSERSKRSIIPISFWWISLFGASMLLAYFVWRRDVVGVIGQTMGWVIYTRNLALIYRLRGS